jgi:hypothetical protein
MVALLRTPGLRKCCPGCGKPGVNVRAATDEQLHRLCELFRKMFGRERGEPVPDRSK